DDAGAAHRQNAALAHVAAAGGVQVAAYRGTAKAGGAAALGGQRRAGNAAYRYVVNRVERSGAGRQARRQVVLVAETDGVTYCRYRSAEVVASICQGNV